MRRHLFWPSIGRVADVASMDACRNDKGRLSARSVDRQSHAASALIPDMRHRPLHPGMRARTLATSTKTVGVHA